MLKCRLPILQIYEDRCSNTKIKTKKCRFEKMQVGYELHRSISVYESLSLTWGGVGRSISTSHYIKYKYVYKIALKSKR